MAVIVNILKSKEFLQLLPLIIDLIKIIIKYKRGR